MPCFVAQSFGLWHRASFWQPLQPWFVKETAFFFAKAQNLRIRLVPNSWDSYAGFLWHRAGLFAAVCRFSLWSVFWGTGVGVADKPRNVLCSFYVVLTGVWGWLGSQGEPRLCFFFHLFYMLPHQ